MGGAESNDLFSSFLHRPLSFPSIQNPQSQILNLKSFLVSGRLGGKNIPQMNRPRVVHVYKDVYPPVEGGIERTIFNLVRLTQGEFDPAVITASRTGRSSIRRIAGGVEVIEVGSLGRVLSTPIAPGFVSALKKSRADLFHFHFPHPTGELAYLLSGLRTPAVVTYHSDVVRQKGTLALYRPFLHRFLRRMSVIMPTSQKYLDTSEILALHRDRCRVVPLGIPVEDYRPTPETEKLNAECRARWGNFVFFIGVLRYYKGLDVLIEAMRDLPGVNLVIAGEGPERKNLEWRMMNSESRNSDVKSQISNPKSLIHFLGRVDHPTAVALFYAAKVFCLPATQRSEAFGLCQIEAMACGLPVVSTDLPTGVPEVNRHGETGLIVPPGDPKTLADALKKVLSDTELRAKLSAQARRRAAELYTAERMASKVSEIYREILSSVRKTDFS